MKLCAHCGMTFHKPPDQGTDGCSCRLHGCGCRIKREAAK